MGGTISRHWPGWDLVDLEWDGRDGDDKKEAIQPLSPSKLTTQFHLHFNSVSHLQTRFHVNVQGRIIYHLSWCSGIAREKSWYKNYWSWCSCSGNIETASERGGILLPAFRLISRRGETRPGLLYSSSQYTSISPLALLQNRNGKIYVHPRNYETKCIKIAGHVVIKIYKQKTTTTKYYLYEIWEKVPFLLSHGLNYIWGCAETSQEETLDFLPTLDLLSNSFELILNSQTHHSKIISWEPLWHLSLLSAPPQYPLGVGE